MARGERRRKRDKKNVAVIVSSGVPDGRTHPVPYRSIYKWRTGGGVRACASTAAAAAAVDVVRVVSIHEFFLDFRRRRRLVVCSRHGRSTVLRLPPRPVFPLLTQTRNTFVRTRRVLRSAPHRRPVTGNRLVAAAVGRSAGDGVGRRGGPRVFSQDPHPVVVVHSPPTPIPGIKRPRPYRTRAYIGINKLPAGRFKNIARRRVTVVTRVRAPPPESTCVRRLWWPRGTTSSRGQGRRLVGSGLVGAGKRPFESENFGKIFRTEKKNPSKDPREPCCDGFGTQV